MAKKKAVQGVVPQDVEVTAGVGGLTDAVAKPANDDNGERDVPMGAVAVNKVLVDGLGTSPDHHFIGNGGELHQVAGGTHPRMTTSTGAVVGDDENSLKAGERGPLVVADHSHLEKLQHFDHERIPERVIHARGYGVHGYFELTDSLAGITSAGIFNRLGEKTPVFVRFSTVSGQYGFSRHLARDVRGFAVKFYTPEGQLGPGRQQHSCVLHSGCNQVHRPDPCSETGAGPRFSAGTDRPRHVLGLRISGAGIDPHADVDHVRPGDSALVPNDGRIWRAYLPLRQSTMRASRPT